MYLFFDTETTGLPNFKSAATDSNQPSVTQLAALLLDADRNVRGEMNLLLRLPEDVIIPAKVTELTGLTTDICNKYGVEPYDAFDLFNGFVHAADYIIAHNIKFDRFLMHPVLSKYPDKTYQCTMEMSKPIIKLPPTDRMRNAGRFDYKVPKLQEAHMHFFGKEFDSAHDAMADVKACAAIYFKMKEAADGLPRVSTGTS
jgi:DNA polymerase-3 subunit epsilon